MLRNIALCLPVIFLFAACGEKGSDKLFTKLSKSDTGINFRNILQESDEMNVLLYQYFYNGAGVAIGDVNNDGLPDVFFSGNMAKNRLYLNKGDLNFEDITEQAGVAKEEGWCTGATFVDINADGWLDLYICRSADLQPQMRRNLLFINTTPLQGGKGGVTFTESAKQYGLDDPGYSTHAAFFDMDKDGDLDCFVINHSLNEYAGDKSEKPGMRQQQNPHFQSKLYAKKEDGKYHDVTEEMVITGNVLSFGLGLGISDVNGDSWPDIYVCNDFNEQDYLFLNRGMSAGGPAPFNESLEEHFDHISHFSMGCDFADFNNDGLPDLATVDMLPDDPTLLKMHSGPDNWKKFDQLFSQGFYYQSMRNMLHLNNGAMHPGQLVDSGTTFSEIGQLAGTSNTDWSWGVLMADFDNDGWKDMVVTNGYVKDYTDMDFLNFAMGKAVESKKQGTNVSTAELIKQMPGSKLSKFAFRNRGGEGTLGFESVAEKWGLAETAFSNGMAYADLDNDGDLDLVVNNINDFASIYRNNANDSSSPSGETGRGWLSVKLVGQKSNPHGYGTKLRLYANGNMQFLEQQPSRGYESSVDHRLHFGLGENTAVDSLVVTWSDSANSKQVIINPKTNQLLVVEQAKAKPTQLPRYLPNPDFLFYQGELGFSHKENEYVDFNTQFLLPHFQSRQGPCIAAGDVNGDGLEDAFIGGAAGQAGVIMLQDFGGDFAPQKTPSLAADAQCEDTGAAFFDGDSDGDLDLYVASGGYEKPAGDGAYQDRIYLNNGKGVFSKANGALPAETAPGTCVTPGDFDGDGDTDLFVGSGCTPANYPEAAESLLLINDGKGHFTNKITELAPTLARPGMVKDAVWLPKERQLVIAGEWMEILILDFGFRYADATIREPKFTVPNSAGWWNRLHPADIDGDGDTDLVAGNLGLNSQMKASPTEPTTLYAADFDGNGAVDPILCHYRNGVNMPAPSRDDLGQQMPSIKKKFNDYKSYATASIEDIVGKDALANAKVLRAEQFRTVWLENTGMGFVLHELPVEAQFAPVYAIASDDFNGDGHVDLFLAGNNRWSRIYFGRYDANHGQVFLGDGKGGFRLLPASQTGTSIRADVRDAALVRGKRGNRIVVGMNDGEAEVLYLNLVDKGL